MKREQLNELLFQGLETELGGVQVYTTAIKCAVNKDLKKEWEEYLQQTQNHVDTVKKQWRHLASIPALKHREGKSFVRLANPWCALCKWPYRQVTPRQRK